MGYRLDITDGEKSVYGSKLYGYLSDEEFDTLESVYYLVKIGKIKRAERFYYNRQYTCPAPITLNANQFRVFIMLYIADLKAPICSSPLIADAVPIFGSELIDLYYSSSEKTISWI